MALKVLHILSGDLHAGKEVQVIAQLAALRNLSDLDVALLLFNDKQTASEARKIGVKILNADEAQGLSELRRDCEKLAAEFKPQIIVTHGYKESFIGSSLARRFSAPLVMTLHGLRERRRGAILKTFLYQLLRSYLLRFSARQIICVSQMMHDSLPPALRKKSCVVRNVITLQNSSPTGEQKNEFIFLGRLSPIKRPMLALEAFTIWSARHPDRRTQLLFVGEGEERANLEAVSHAENIFVRFTGFVSNARSLLRGTRALLLTSESEGMPTVILEAIDVGVPIVSSDLPGVREILSFCPNYPAVLVDSATPAAFADAIEKVWDLPSSSTDYRAILQKYFSPEAAALQQRDIYLSLV